MSSSASASLETLPREALKHVLLFLGNVPDFLSCEKTCKKFHSVISDDSVWQGLPLKDAQSRLFLRNWHCYTWITQSVQTHREVACINHNIRLNKRYVKGLNNILLEAFDNKGTACARWKEIVQRILERFLPPELSGHKHYYFLRGDTMGTLIDFLESYLIRSFERAMLVCTGSSKNVMETEFPTLTTQHFQIQHSLGQNTVCRRSFTANEEAWALSLIDTDKREKITRRTGLAAGAIKQDNLVSVYAWTSLVHLIAGLFQPACEELVLRASYHSISSLDKSKTRRTLISGCISENIRSVPPLPTVLSTSPGSSNNDHGEDQLLHTPVPRQIEEAAARLLPTFPTKTYNFWLTDEGEWWSPEYSAENAEYDAAVAEYDFVDEEEAPDLKRPRIDSVDEHSASPPEYTVDEFGVNDDQSTDSLLDSDFQNALDDGQSASGSEGDDDDRSSASSESQLLSAPSDDEEEEEIDGAADEADNGGGR